MHTKTKRPINKVIAIQETLRPALPTVIGCKDYEDEKTLLERVDRILRISGTERYFLDLSMKGFEAHAAKLREKGEKVLDGTLARLRYARHSHRALRCMVLKALKGDSFRELSKALAMAPLYRWFCSCEDFEVIRVPGKSMLQGYSQWLGVEDMENGSSKKSVGKNGQNR